MRIVERATGVERDKAGRKSIVCVPVWHRGGGDVSRVPQYTKVLRSSTATIQGRVRQSRQSVSVIARKWLRILRIKIDRVLIAELSST